jgi:hypothetical protein
MRRSRKRGSGRRHRNKGGRGIENKKVGIGDEANISGWSRRRRKGNNAERRIRKDNKRRDIGEEQ